MQGLEVKSEPGPFHVKSPKLLERSKLTHLDLLEKRLKVFDVFNKEMQNARPDYPITFYF